MPIKVRNGRMRVVPTKAKQTALRVDDTEHQIARLYTTLHNINARLVAAEAALANNSAPAPRKRTRCSQPSTD